MGLLGVGDGRGLLGVGRGLGRLAIGRRGGRADTATIEVNIARSFKNVHSI